MYIINSDLFNIIGGLVLLVAGLIAVLISIPRLKTGEFTLLNLGFFFSLYGIRWLIEIQDVPNFIGVTSPLNLSYLHSFLTYLLPIPFSAFLLNVLGRGLFGSMLWFFISTILYAIAAILYDMFSGQAALNPSISTVVLAFWCIIGGINVILIHDPQKTELKVLKFTLYFLILCLANDNLVTMNAVPWNIRLEHIDIIVLFAGMAYIAVRHYFSPGKASYGRSELHS